MTTMKYTSKLIGPKTYEITTTFNDEEITFNVVVASKKAELDGLVQHHLDYLANPTPKYPTAQPDPTPSLEETVKQQAEIIQALSDRLAAAGL